MINNKELSQIGDNDSGKIFYKFHDEHKPLQIDWLINLIDKIYQNSESEIDTSIKYLDNQIIEDLNLDSMNKASHTKIKFLMMIMFLMVINNLDYLYGEMRKSF